MKFTMSAYILTGIISLISLISIIVNSLIFAEVGSFVNNNTAVTAISMACSAILLILCVSVFTNCSYTFKEKSLYIWFGVYFIKFAYDDILAVAIDKTTNRLYIQFKSNSKKKEFNIFAINIRPELNDAFINEIMRRNPNIVRPVIENTDK